VSSSTPCELAFDEKSIVFAAQPSTKGKASEARTDDGRSDADLLGYNIPRPGLVGHASSFNGSDVWGGGPSDANGSVSDNAQRPPSQRTADGASAAQEPMTHASSAVLPLVRTVSSGAKAAIDEAGLEYIHEGHGMVAVEAHLLRRSGSASRTRRRYVQADGGVGFICSRRQWLFSLSVGLSPTFRTYRVYRFCPCRS
jgi:hypothetical protein